MRGGRPGTAFPRPRGPAGGAPNLVGFVEEVGLGPAIAYGVDSQKQLEAEVFRKFWTLRNPVTVWHESREYATEGWADMGRAAEAVADGADLLLTGTTYQEVAGNVAQARGIPWPHCTTFRTAPTAACCRSGCPAPWWTPGTPPANGCTGR